jgi:hypothetical protein
MAAVKSVNFPANDSQRAPARILIILDQPFAKVEGLPRLTYLRHKVRPHLRIG